ncbi:MAG: LysM peptidoglycan-binding domain-containing protein [Methylococcales bacterium]|nr:LysM peptidoglycan-binding domain-containing protein [Methylococcaceae bacterium]
MQVNFNRSANFLLLLISLIIVGCTDTSKAPLSISDTPPQSSQVDNGYVRHPTNKTGFFNKNKVKISSDHKNTVWERMLAMYSLPDIDNERIDREVEWYLQHPASLAIIQQRAQPYLHHILEEIDAKDIPGELALLPVVESAFLPDAYSKSDASGLWQFIPSTGNDFGLQQNYWYDGRRDVYASTKAATDYLKQLSETFDGDWLLALASYNYGKGNVRKAIERNEDLNLPTDYWSLSLPEETMNYVPRLLAVARIFANADDYNIRLQHIPNKPYFEVVDVHSQLDLPKAAELADTPLFEILKLNPGFNHATTSPQGPHQLLIPVEKVESFKHNLAQLPYDERVKQKFIPRDTSILAKREEPEPRLLTSLYKVKAGEGLTAIARKHNTSIEVLRKANHLTSSVVRVGTVLQIPGVSTKATSKYAGLPLLTAKANNDNALTTAQSYSVKKGDTLFNVAKRFSMGAKEVAQMNNLNPQSALVSGQKLKIKSVAGQSLAVASSAVPVTASANNARSISYIVRQGDSLVQISRKFNVSVTDLRKWNAPTAVNKSLTPGKIIKVILSSGNRTT